MAIIPITGVGAKIGTGEVLIYKITGADMQSTTDQAMTKMASFNKAQATRFVAVAKTGTSTGAATGGVYTAASKAGSAIIAASQSWATDSTASLVTTAAGSIIAAGSVVGKFLSTGTAIFSLAVGSATPATADIMIYGVVIS